MEDSLGHETSTRRGLLRALARNAAQHARDGIESVGPAVLDTPAMAASLVPPEPKRHPARTPQSVASVEELLAIAHAEDLTQRDGELRALVRRSFRMTPIEAERAPAWILTGENSESSSEEVPLAMINLAETPTQDRQLPAEGWLVLLVGSAGGSAGREARHAHGVLRNLPPVIPPAAEPVGLHPELVIPRRWHAAVQSLNLDDREAEAYDRVRARLQTLQGVESDEVGGPAIAYHRLLGYPDETSGGMPLDCVHSWRIRSLADGLADELGRLPSSWQLLAQVSVGERRRAYVWIHESDLAAAEFGRLCAFVR